MPGPNKFRAAQPDLAKSLPETDLCGANRGHDTDTTGAVCGQIFGAYQGESGIPAE